MKETTEEYLERVIRRMIDNEGFEIVSQTNHSTVYYSEKKMVYAVYVYGQDIWEGTHNELVQLAMEL